MKILFKSLGILLIVTLGGIFLMITINSEKLPKGINQVEAEVVANKMLLAINDSAWQKMGTVSWEYRNHEFIWDKERHLTQVKFDAKEVLIDINARKGVIVKGGDGLSDDEKISLCNDAWKLWVNDSFWLNPISKCKDPGTVRKMVDLDDGRKGLMVSYESGGVTPGDSYVWILDENFRPVAWKLWVSIIPIKGIELTWGDWVQLKTGVWIATSHEGLVSLPLSNPKGYTKLSDLTNGIDIFQSLGSAKIYF